MRRSMIALCSAVLCPAACGDSPTSDTRIHVDGVYDTAVQLVSNTCGAVTVQPQPTTVTHSAGATSLTLTHAGVTYQGTLQGNGAFTTAPRQLSAGAESYNILVSGQFSRNGFTAQVTVQVTRPAGPCDYQVAWTGTRQSGANVIP